jgi:ankyrin repeat protein
VKNSKPRFIKVLLKFNALINAQDIEGNYPLSCRLSRADSSKTSLPWQKTELIPIFRTKTAERVCTGLSTISQSDADASNEIENTLVSNCRREGDMNTVDQRGRTPLHYAFIKIGDPFAFTNIDPIETVSNIISRPNVKIDLRDNWGNTPLHYAAQRGSVISALYFMKNGADFNALNDDGNSPLNICLICGHQNMAIFLIQKGVNLKLDIKVKDTDAKESRNRKEKTRRSQRWRGEQR